MRRSPWKDFLDDNVAKPWSIDNNILNTSLSVDKFDVSKNGKSIVNGYEKTVLTQNLKRSGRYVKKTKIDLRSMKTGLMTLADTENDLSRQQMEPTDLAFSISKFFDKKLKSKSAPLNIYLTKCPCRKCHTFRRINRPTVNKESSIQYIRR